MVTLTERAKIQADEVHVGRALLAALLAIFWAVGWLVGQVANGVVLCVAAVRVGYRDARPKVNRGPARQG